MRVRATTQYYFHIGIQTAGPTSNIFIFIKAKVMRTAVFPFLMVGVQRTHAYAHINIISR